MIVVYCQSPIDRKQPDEMYQAEADASASIGFARRLIDFEALVSEDNIEKCLRSIPDSAVRLIGVYRGWMMSPSNYEKLFNGLAAKGITLINSPKEYKHCHYLPEWISDIGDNTPKSSVLALDSAEQLSSEKLRTSLAPFGSDSVIVKDFVKSEKHNWADACFIPDASDLHHAMKVCERFLQLRGSDLEGGLVIRKFMHFNKLGVHPKSGMPLTEEFRAFVLDGRLMAVMKYWDEVQYPVEEPAFEPLLNLVASVPSNFFTVDCARLENGEWMIVELGDGQVAGLPDNMNLRAFYDALQHSKQEGVGELLPRAKDHAFNSIVRSTLATTPIAERLKSHSAVVLERIACGAGATRWYYCEDKIALQSLEARLSPGSAVSFYFDDRIRGGSYSPEVKETMFTLYAERREPLIGSLRKDGVEIDMVFIDPSDLAEYEPQFQSSPLVFYGEFPGWDNDGITCVTLTLPDADGVVRSHPH